MSRIQRWTDNLNDWFWAVRMILLVAWNCLVIFFRTGSLRALNEYVNRVDSTIKELRDERERLYIRLISARDDEQRKQILEDFAEYQRGQRGNCN